MWLKKLTLKNFQKHESLTLEFTPGVNYIYGHSDAGKSCIRRAIGFLFFGEPRADAVIRKEGTKQTSVLGLLDNGTEVERVKSATINRYVVRVPGSKEQVYDSIGATIPEEVQQVLQASVVTIDKESLNLNMADQISMPFLTDVPGTFRLKLFNKLTGNDLIDKVVQNINKEILSLGREIKIDQDVIDTNKPLLETIENKISSRENVLKEYQTIRYELNDKVLKLKTLEDLYTQMTKAKENIAANSEVLGKIKTIDETTIETIKSRLVTLKALETLKLALDMSRKNISESEAQLKEVGSSEVSTEEVKKKIDHLKELEIIKDEISLRNNNIKKLEEELYDKNQALLTGNDEYKSLLRETKICPTCKAEMTEEHVSHILL